MKKLVIAIDGPAGAGKSSVAKVLAKRLSYTYLDTGAMYRAITYEALRRGVSDEAAVTAMAETLTMDIFPKTDTMHVTVDGEDITDKLRGTDVSQHVSKISSMAGVRAVMVKLQREKSLERRNRT